VGIRKPRRLVADLLADGRAFETSGCVACNRPYYNERPGQVPYNYPRPLTAGEQAAAASIVLALVQDRPAAEAEGC
jgi:biotin synthase-related radical SAM superfamily protein